MDEFKQLYSLKGDDVLIRVAPPFLPERLDFYKRTRRSQAEAVRSEPAALLVRWVTGDLFELPPDGGLSIWGVRFGGPETLTGLAEMLLEIYPQELEGDRELLALQLPGDFVFRADAEENLYLTALAKITQDLIGTPVNFGFRQVECSVVVLRGKWNFSPVDDIARGRGQIEIYSGKLDSDRNHSCGAGSGDGKAFAGWVGQAVRQQVVIEADNVPERLRWRYNNDSSQMPGGLQPSKDLMLKHIEEQTGLVNTIETREVRRLLVERGEL